MRLPLGKDTAVGEPRQNVLGCCWGRLLRFQKCFNVSYWRLRRGVGGNRDIYRDGSSEANDEGESGHVEGIK